MDEVIINHDDKDYIISPDADRYFINTNDKSFEDIKKALPDKKWRCKRKVDNKEEKQKDKVYTLYRSNIRAIINRYICGANWCIYTAGIKSGHGQNQSDKI